MATEARSKSRLSSKKTLTRTMSLQRQVCAEKEREKERHGSEGKRGRVACLISHVRLFVCEDWQLVLVVLLLMISLKRVTSHDFSLPPFV